MAFWGIEVKPGKPVVHSCKKRIRITQATLGFGDAVGKCLVQCNIGTSSPVYLCALLPNTTESCYLNLEFEEEDDVIFSVLGPRSVHLVGHYVYRYHNPNLNSDDLSPGIDIENTESEKSSEDAEDDEYEDSFINDCESPEPSPRPRRQALIYLGTKKLKDKKQRHKRLKKKNRVIKSDDDLEVQDTDDEDGCLLSVLSKEKPMKAVAKEEGSIAHKSEDDTLGCDLKEKDHEQERKKEEREVTPQKIEPLGGEVAIKEDVNSDFKTIEDNALENNVEPALPIDKNEDQIYDQHSVKRKRDIQFKEDEMVVDKDVKHIDGPGQDDNIQSNSVINAESRCEDGRESRKMKEVTDIAATSDNRLEISDKMEKTMEKDLPNHDEQMAEALCNHKDVNETPLEVKTLSNGLVVEVLVKGDPNGKVALPGKKVKVNLIGMLKENGCIIESNVGKSPFKYILGREDLIDGLNMGVDGMRVGEKRRITIPPSLGFGEDGYEETVPPNSWLVYYVELVGARR